MWGWETVEYFPDTLLGNSGIILDIWLGVCGTRKLGYFPDTCLGVQWPWRLWDVSQHFAGCMWGWIETGIFPDTWLGCIWGLETVGYFPDTWLRVHGTR